MQRWRRRRRRRRQRRRRRHDVTRKVVWRFLPFEYHGIQTHRECFKSQQPRIDPRLPKFLLAGYHVRVLFMTCSACTNPEIGDAEKF